MEEKVTIENVLKEYEKYLLSRLIDKEYDFNNLRDIVKEFNKHDDIFNYDDEQSNYEVANNIKNISKGGFLFDNKGRNKWS